MLGRVARSGGQSLHRLLSTLTEAERGVEQKIRAGLKVLDVSVKDTSGGCGAMYSIEVVAEDFK